LTWGRREEAERQWLQAKESAARTRDAQAAFVPFQIDGLIAALDGRLERAVEIGAEAQARGNEIDRETAGRQAGARLARRPLLYLGRVEEALAGTLIFDDLFAAGGVFAGQRALYLAHLGRVDEAADILSRMVAERDMSSPSDPTTTAAMRYLLETAVVLRDADSAAILENRMAPMAGLLHTEADMCYNIGRLCGGAAALRDDAEMARGYYLQALEICERVRFRPEIALTRLEMAELMLGTNPEPSTPLSDFVRHESTAEERAKALEHLEFAIGEFREMKMQPSLERALRHKELLRA
jgi:hypothetical protein